MPATVESEPNDICVFRISGVLHRAEFGQEQDALAKKIDAGARPRLLFILDGFEGFERGADWNDLDFLYSHSDKIAKIAIVGDPRWEVQTLAFTGAGFRSAPVKFFPADELSLARTWLRE
jgi:hypothetical protein